MEIFGRPVFVYSHREAVVDGDLVDHEPPIRIHTQLSSEGIRWRAGEQVTTSDPRTGQIDLFTTPDELRFDVAAVNQQVITELSNRVVCEALADELDLFLARQNPDLPRQQWPRRSGGAAAEGTVPSVGPVEVRFGNRRCFTGAKVSGQEVVLGAIPMEDMDLVSRPQRQRVEVNPESPNIPLSGAMGFG